MRRPFRRKLGAAITAAAVITTVQLAFAPAGRCGDAPVQKLEVNPVFARVIPPPGWLSDHTEAWVEEHAAYRAACRDPEVVDEIRYLNRVIASSQFGLDTFNVKVNGNAMAALEAKQAIDEMHRDIITADKLAARLDALPTCTDTQTATAVRAGPTVPATASSAPPPTAVTAVTFPGPTAPTPPSEAAGPVAPVPVPAPAATPPTPPTAAASPIALPSAPAPTAATASQADTPQRVVIQFDDRLPALTQAGIRAFRAAVDAARSGKKPEIAIEGCDAKANFSNGSQCARRRASLEALLAQNGVHDPKSLFADLH